MMKRDGGLSPEEWDALDGELQPELAKRLGIPPHWALPKPPKPYAPKTQGDHGPKHTSHPVSHSRP